MGGARGAEPRLVEGLQGDPSPCGGIQKGGLPPFESTTQGKLPTPYPLPRTNSLRRGRCAGAGGGRSFYTSHFKGGDGRQWRPSIADRGGSRDQAPPFGTPDGGGSRGKIFLFGDGGLLEGNSSSRRKVTAAAGRGRILVRGPYCLRCASEAWQWRLSFLENRKKSRKSLKDFLLRGGAGGWRGFWRHQKSKFIIGITVPASHSA